MLGDPAAEVPHGSGCLVDFVGGPVAEGGEEAAEGVLVEVEAPAVGVLFLDGEQSGVGERGTGRMKVLRIAAGA